MPELPRGTVTFLFTDIEGSTALWERDRAAMRSAVDRQLAILHNLISAHHGVLYKTVGDGTQAAFASAEEALRAALASQRALLAEDWGDPLGPLRVRMALHAGEATPDARGDYLTASLNRLSRLLSTGHGGQILLSQTVQQLTRGVLPAGAELRDLGEHRLRDLLEPERVFQLLHPDLSDQFPPLTSLENRPNNLPRQPTPFLGREREVGEIVSLLQRENVQLLTLTGPGGTGKTRLALQVAAEVLDNFADGVFFVPLAPLTDAALVPSAIAAALGLREDAEQPVAPRVLEFLATKTLLLILDNFEHLLAAVPGVADLLSAAPNLTVLATSRAPLHVRAEREHPVLPLTLPRRWPLPTPEQLTQYEAVRLFIARAQAVKPDFAVDNDNAPAVAEICWRLDGLPLAIELAAARVRLFPPEALLTRLEKRLPFLTGGARDAPARQQTLRAAIAWSHDLLHENERPIFRRLAVFAGGCTLEAAEAVVNPDGELDALGGVTALVEQSLLRLAADSVDEPRIEMLETVSEYALDQLAASGEATTIRHNHAKYYLNVAEAADARAGTLEHAAWLDRLDTEHPNLRAALTWAIGSGDADPSLGPVLASALGSFWRLRGHLREGLDWLQRSLANDGSPSARLRAMDRITSLARQLQDRQLAAATAEAAMTLAETHGEKSEIAEAQLRLASALAESGDGDRSSTLLAEALAWYQSRGDAIGQAQALVELGFLAEAHADFAQARALATEAEGLFRAAGDHRGVLHCLFTLGSLDISEGEGDRALDLFEDAVALCRTIGNTTDVAAAGYTLGLLHADHLGDDAAAEPYLLQSLELWQRVSNTEYQAGVLWEMGRLATRSGDFALAEARHQEALALREASPDPIVATVGSAEAAIGFGDIARAKGDRPTALAHHRQGLVTLRVVAPDEWQRPGVVGQWVKQRCAESLRVAVCTAGSEANASRAAQVLGAADAFRRLSGWGVLRAEADRQRRDADPIRAWLSQDGFIAAWTAGQGLTIEAALDEALALTNGA